MDIKTPASVRKKVTGELQKRERQVPLVLVHDALERHHGNVTDAAKDLDMSYLKLRTMIDNNGALQNVMVAQREGLLDLAETKLRENLINNSQRAVEFTLKTLGQRRGYIERSEPTAPRMPDHSIKAKLDVTKLSTEQLIQLKGMMTAAQGDDIIDVTPDEMS